jgi:outer membrane protein TolC
MRFTKKLCALAVSLAITASAQVAPQTPPPTTAPAVSDSDEAKLREALRKALDSGTGTQTTPAPSVPVPPVTPVVPIVRPATTNVPMVLAAPTYGVTVTNGGTNVTMMLSLEQAITLALENNLLLKVNRYAPVISELTRLSLYGYYDPVFTGDYTWTKTTREEGGFNPNTGRETPGQQTQTDTANFGVTGVLPTGMTYDIGHLMNNVVATRMVDTGLTNAFGQPIFARAVNDTWDGGVGITVSQPLLRNFWIDSTRLGIKLARRDVEIADLTFERMVMDIIRQVEQAYYGLIAERELVRVYESDVAVKKQFFEENKRRVEVGTLRPLDEKLAQSELALAEITVAVQRNNVLNAERLLKGLIHDNFVQQLNVNLILTDKLLPVPPPVGPMFEEFREATEKRPDLQLQRITLEKAQIQLKFAFNQLFPQLDLFGTLRYNGLDRELHGVWSDIRTREFEQDIAGLRLTLPFTFWKERQEKKRAEASKEQQIWTLKQTEELVLQEVEFQARLLRTTWDTIPMRREQVTYQQAALEAERRMLEVGKSTSFNVLEIASRLALAQANEVGTLRDYNQALAEYAFRKGTTLERWRIDRPARTTR